MQRQPIRAVRTEIRPGLGGRTKTGKLAPVLAVPFGQGESGMLAQFCELELDQLAGRLESQLTVEVNAVYVPVLACDELKNAGTVPYAGTAESFRDRLMSGQVMFDLEDENEISKRCGVEPASYGGVLKVNEVVRLAHNCAVNFLRQRKYVKAALLSSTAPATITPALIGRSVLDRLNAVLDPEDRVNGSVAIAGQARVKATAAFNSAVISASAPDFDLDAGVAAGDNSYGPLYADLAAAAQGLSLNDFYLAETRDRLARAFRALVDANPQHGEEIAARFAHGLDVEMGREPWLLYRNEMPLENVLRGAMDGPNLGQMQTEPRGGFEFTVPVPPNEFGGIVITFISVKPDEALATQPHPILTKTWEAENYAADELKIDPFPVTMREVDSSVALADEGTIAFYNGHNHLQRSYVHYGWNRQLDLTTVAAKTSIFQLQVPMSVTPDSVIYPQDLPQYPWADQTAEVVRYHIQSRATINTPKVFGPAPVEELAEITTSNLLEDNPA